MKTKSDQQKVQLRQNAERESRMVRRALATPIPERPNKSGIARMADRELERKILEEAKGVR